MFVGVKLHLIGWVYAEKSAAVSPSAVVTVVSQSQRQVQDDSRKPLIRKFGYLNKKLKLWGSSPNFCAVGIEKL